VFALVVRFDLQPDTAERFDKLVNDLVPAVREGEPGTLVYTCTKVTDAGDFPARIFFEVYRDRDAFDEHEHQAHVKAFHVARAPLMAGVRVEFLEPYAAVGLPGETG
jgi:quinol monooxygenase YgiN